MSILIGGVNKNNPPSMRTLMLDGNQKYRLVISDQYRSTLVYAKGWIDFDPNPIKDGSGNTIDYYGQLSNNEYWASLHAFYDDGFYAYNSSSSTWLKIGSALTGTNTLFSTAANFNGWYTKSSGGDKIDSIEDVYRYTNLFNHKNSTSIPRITLYAHWTIKQMTVYVNNITRYNSSNEYETAISSFKYNGYRTMATVTLQVPYNTELISYLRKKISSPQYITWARYKLDGTSQQQALRNGVQSFIGWYTSGNGNGTIWTDYYVTNTVNIYPQFSALVIWPKVKFPTVTVGGITYWGGTSASGYCTFNVPASKGSAIHWWETERGNTATNEIPDPWGGYRVYDNCGFPLGSANTAIIYLRYEV